MHICALYVPLTFTVGGVVEGELQKPSGTSYVIAKWLEPGELKLSEF